MTRCTSLTLVTEFRLLNIHAEIECPCRNPLASVEYEQTGSYSNEICRSSKRLSKLECSADEMNCPMPRSVEKVPVRNEKRCTATPTPAPPRLHSPLMGPLRCPVLGVVCRSAPLHVHRRTCATIVFTCLHRWRRMSRCRRQKSRHLTRICQRGPSNFGAEYVMLSAVLGSLGTLERGQDLLWVLRRRRDAADDIRRTGI